MKGSARRLVSLKDQTGYAAAEGGYPAKMRHRELAFVGLMLLACDGRKTEESATPEFQRLCAEARHNPESRAVLIGSVEMDESLSAFHRIDRAHGLCASAWEGWRTSLVFIDEAEWNALDQSCRMKFETVCRVELSGRHVRALKFANAIYCY